MIGEITEEKRDCDSNDDSVGLCRVGQLPSFQLDGHDAVADENHHEGDEEPTQEPCDDHGFVPHPPQPARLLGRVIIRQCKIIVTTGDIPGTDHGVPKDQVWGAEQDSQDPRPQSNPGRQLRAPAVVGPDGEGHGNAAVNADDRQEEDAGKHVEEGDGAVQLAQELPKGPVEAQGGVSDAEGQEEGEDEVSYGQVEEPDGIHRLFHLEACNPNDEAVPCHPQETGDAVHHHGEDVHGLLEARVVVMVSGVLRLLRGAAGREGRGGRGAVHH